MSSYDGRLSSISSEFTRRGAITGYYYYQALRVTISASGTYILTSVSSMDTYGYLYNGSVDLSDTSQNLITFDDDGGGGIQFRLSSYLSSGSSYVLIVTTHRERQTGHFSIRASGPATVIFTELDFGGSQLIQVPCKSNTSGVNA